MEKIQTSQQGRIVKIEIDGLKHYAVISGKTANKTYILRFPKYMAGDVAIVEQEVAVPDIKPVSLDQNGPIPDLLRQLTGVKQAQKALPFGKKPTSSTGKLKPEGKPEPAVPVKDEGVTILSPVKSIDDFEIQGVKIKDMPEGEQKEIAKGIAKNMMGLGGCNGIEFK